MHHPGRWRPPFPLPQPEADRRECTSTIPRESTCLRTARPANLQQDIYMVNRRQRFLVVLCACVSLSAAANGDDPDTNLARWYEEVGPPRPSEPFGRYLARTARVKHGVKYEEVSPEIGPETLRVELDAFECVSFIESSLAVARCGWSADPTQSCFVRELEATRYRSGEMGDYASRLHYFVDWIADNERRGRLSNVTASLGGEPMQKDFFYISQRELKRTSIDASQLASLTDAIESTEARLSATTHSVLSRENAPAVLNELLDGDLVAFVRERPGLLVHHAGLVYWAGGTPRLLHASSYHGRVVITVRDVTNYLLRRSERRGVIVARPTTPQEH